eukprot:bmy_14923T0
MACVTTHHNSKNYSHNYQLSLITSLNWIRNKYNSHHPYHNKNFNPRATEASTKYFLTQATASILLIIAVIINLLHSS